MKINDSFPARLLEITAAALPPIVRLVSPPYTTVSRSTSASALALSSADMATVA